jgi:hypothetical protein
LGGEIEGGAWNGSARFCGAGAVETEDDAAKFPPGADVAQGLDRLKSKCSCPTGRSLWETFSSSPLRLEEERDLPAVLLLLLLPWAVAGVVVDVAAAALPGDTAPVEYAIDLFMRSCMKGSMQSGLRFPCAGDAEAEEAGLIPAASGSPTTADEGHLEHVTPILHPEPELQEGRQNQPDKKSRGPRR